MSDLFVILWALKDGYQSTLPILYLMISIFCNVGPTYRNASKLICEQITSPLTEDWLVAMKYNVILPVSRFQKTAKIPEYALYFCSYCFSCTVDYNILYAILLRILYKKGLTKLSTNYSTQ